jgi:hypothetical protein
MALPGFINSLRTKEVYAQFEAGINFEWPDDVEKTSLQDAAVVIQLDPVNLLILNAHAFRNFQSAGDLVYRNGYGVLWIRSNREFNLNIEPELVERTKYRRVYRLAFFSQGSFDTRQFPFKLVKPRCALGGETRIPSRNKQDLGSNIRQPSLKKPPR